MCDASGATRVNEYLYGGAGRALSLKRYVSVENYVENATYAPHGALSGSLNGRISGGFVGFSTAYTYNNRLQPAHMLVTTGTLDLACTNVTGKKLHFLYNFNSGTANNGNVASISNCKDSARTQNFTYDELNRVLTAQTTSNLWGNSFVYDIWGNLTNMNPIAGKIDYQNLQAAPASEKNQLPGYSYDSAGNMTNAGSGVLTYDAENRLINAAGVNYVYDGDGKRVKKSNGKAYWYGPDGQVQAESDLAGTWTIEHMYFNGQRVARRELLPAYSLRYHFSDHLGSASFVTNTSGTNVDESDYYPFGGERIITNSDPSQYKFTGKERDLESVLDYFGARHDSAAIGRWISADPINLTRARLSNPSNTLNKYVYAANNPLKFVDRDGEDITIFYRPAGMGVKDFGHIFIGALNQDTGQVGFLDYYPQGTGNGPGEFNTGNMQERAAAVKEGQFATLTIQTTPEQAQKVLNLITALTSGTPPDFAALSNNCTTICQDVLHDLGLDFGDITPAQYWNHVYGNFSAAAQANPFRAFFVPHKTGVEYGKPRDFGMNFTALLFQLYLNRWNERQNNQKPPKACVTIYGPKGPDTTCYD